jgi:hypothetical protein
MDCIQSKDVQYDRAFLYINAMNLENETNDPQRYAHSMCDPSRAKTRYLGGSGEATPAPALGIIDVNSTLQDRGISPKSLIEF